MNPDTVITFEPIYANPTSWRMRANGVEIGCATVRCMGAIGGLYFFRTKQALVTFKEAQNLFKAHFAGDGACKFCGDMKICGLPESGNEAKSCVPCECYRARIEAVRDVNGLYKSEPQKDTNAAPAANTEGK